MQIFYSFDINNGVCRLDEEETRHCVGVLRKKEGDIIHITNGKGELFVSRIVEIQKRNCLAEIIETNTKEKLPYYLHLAVAPTKSIDRFEWFVEKAVEVGIHEITPLFCEHSERKSIKQDRLNKIALSAMKQSGNIYLPKINEMSTFESFMNSQASLNYKYIAYCGDSNKVDLHQAFHQENAILVLIGPEGDFSEEEVSIASKNGFQPISLGNSRLRTETAALAVCFALSLRNQF